MRIQKKSLAVSIVFIALSLGACQPKAPESSSESDTELSSSTSASALLSLQGSNEKLKLKLPDCQGKSCPSFDIERLHSNQFVLDDVIDQAIIENLKEMLDPVQQQALQQAGAKLLAAANADAKQDQDRTEVGAQDQRNQSQSLKDQSAHGLTVKDPNAQASSTAQLALAQHALETPAQRLSEQIQPYFETFIGLTEELKTLGANHQLSLSVHPRILNSTPPLATVVINSSSYLGGAHGASSQKYYNFDLEKQKILKLQDLLLPQQQANLEKLAYAAFKTWVKDNQLADNIAEYEQVWKFKLSSNYYLGQQGLILQYAEYEIGPYVVGLARLDIPYSELKGILKPAYFPPSTQADAVKNMAAK